MPEWEIICGEALDVLKTYPDNYFDAMVTDPPAGISMMGKQWDSDKGGRDKWIAWLSKILAECHRVLKPGAHILVWALPRTSHWTGMAIEDAGFALADICVHLFGSGFPKNYNVAKAIAKAAGDGADYEGIGTALKPAMEMWHLARAPLENGLTIARNVLKWGTGGINIDGCRVPTNAPAHRNANREGEATADKRYTQAGSSNFAAKPGPRGGSPSGRWPANLLLTHHPSCVSVGKKTIKGYTINRFTDGAKPFGNGAGHPYESEKQPEETIEVFDCHPACSVRLLDEQSGVTQSTVDRNLYKGDTGSLFAGKEHQRTSRGDKGGASRFFTRFLYQAKPSKREKNAGLPDNVTNDHPTVKSTDLMTWLCRLVTPPGGTILDPFAGSGSTGIGAVREGFNFVGIDKDEHYCDIARSRLQHWHPQEEKQEIPSDAKECPNDKCGVVMERTSETEWECPVCGSLIRKVSY